MKKIKKLRLKIRIKRSVSFVCMILFYLCFVAKVDSTAGIAIIAIILLTSAGVFFLSAAYDIRKLKKIQERRSNCFSKMLAFNED